MTEQVFEIRRVDQKDQAFEAVLGLAAGKSKPAALTISEWIADLISKKDFETLGQKLIFGAFRGSTLHAAAAALESQGQSALVFFDVLDNTATSHSAVSQCLQALRETAKTTNVEILQILMEVDDVQSREMLQRAGFKHLTKLVYFIRPTQSDDEATSNTTEINWLSYSSERNATFCEALDASYIGSFDCPELSGQRKTEEVLQGHRPREGFDPTLWQVAMKDKRPIGIVLLNSLFPQRALEIVYIGVPPEVRGCGVSDALMARTLAESKRRAFDFITVAADARNEPAIKLYLRWQFERCLERDAWLAIR